MRVAVIHYDLTAKGGAERVALLYARLEDLGFDVRYYTCFLDGGFKEFEKLDVVVVEPFVKQRGLARGYSALLNALKLLQMIRADSWAELHVLNTNYYLALSLRPAFLYVHFPERLTVSGVARKLLHFPLDVLEAKAMREAEVIASNSKYTASFVRKLYGRDDVQVIPPGIDIERYIFKPGEGRYFLSVNRFVPYKNLELAIYAHSELVKSLEIGVELVLAGSTVKGYEWYPAKLKSLAEKLGTGDLVRFKSNVGDEELLQLYANSIAILYTPLEEHFGIVPLEAMASGKPVIVSNSGGPAETVVNGVTGFRLPPEPKIWARKMALLLENRALRLNMGLKARSLVEKRFSSKYFVETVAKILKKLAKYTTNASAK